MNALRFYSWFWLFVAPVVAACALVAISSAAAAGGGLFQCRDLKGLPVTRRNGCGDFCRIFTDWACAW